MCIIIVNINAIKILFEKYFKQIWCVYISYIKLNRFDYVERAYKKNIFLELYE